MFKNGSQISFPHPSSDGCFFHYLIFNVEFGILDGYFKAIILQMHEFLIFVFGLRGLAKVLFFMALTKGLIDPPLKYPSPTCLGPDEDPRACPI